MPATKPSENQGEDGRQQPRDSERSNSRLLTHGTHAARAGVRLLMGRSPSPLEDERSPAWANEDRAFQGIINRELTRPLFSAQEALAAQKSALMVDGRPQYVIFCDGSSGYQGTRNVMQDGGCAVVFRDPYDEDKAATARASELATAEFEGDREEDGIKIGDFTIRNWVSHRTYGSAHVELAALAQAFEEVIKREDKHKPGSSVVKIYTDSDPSLLRIENGILSTRKTTGGRDRKRKRNTSAEEMGKRTFFEGHTNPFVRLIVWQSHYLSDRGCTIELHWMPRNTTLAHRLADHMAGQWKGKVQGDGFNQRYLPPGQGDSLLDKLHEEVGAVERAWAKRQKAMDLELYEELSRENERPTKRSKVDEAISTQKRSTEDYILLDSDSEEERGPQQQQQQSGQGKKSKVDPALKAQKRSTEDYMLLESESEKEHQPRKRRHVQRMNIPALAALAASKAEDPVQFISQATEWRKGKASKVAIPAKKKAPTQWKKRRVSKGAIPPKKKAPKLKTRKLQAPKLQSAPAPEASGFLHGENHAFDFDPGNLPAYPTAGQKEKHNPALPKAVKDTVSVESQRPNVRCVLVPDDDEAGGLLLNDQERDVTLDLGNSVPAHGTPRPSQNGGHNPELGHGNPGCPLCQQADDEDVVEWYPWRSGYTGLPSQWALRRY